LREVTTSMTLQVLQGTSFRLPPDIQLSGVQRSAIDLYQRGLNVFPVCRPEEVAEIAQINPKKFNKEMKLPYILNPLFYSRLHLCNSGCADRESRTGLKCYGNRNGCSFTDLFDFSNLGVMLGRTSGNLVCIDCDTMPAFQVVLREFTIRNLNFWGYYTSRGGNLLFRLAEGEAVNMDKCAIIGVQIWGYHHFCVLPPSVHAAGIVYTWLDRTEPAWHLPQHESPPVLHLGELEWLGVKVHEKQTKQQNLFGLPEWTCCLSENNRKILASEIPEGQRNIMLTKATYDVAAAINNILVPYEEAEQLLLWTASRCQPPYPPKQVRQMLNSAINKSGLRLSRDFYSHSTIEHHSEAFVSQAEYFLSTYAWSTHGRTAQTDKAVFAACITRAKLDRADGFRASIREVADLANIQQPFTANRALHRLCKKELLHPLEKDTSGAQRFLFGDEVTVHHQHTNPLLKNSGLTMHTHFVPQDRVEQDISLKLGRISFNVWKHLQQFPEPGATAISSKTGLNRSSISRSLKKLITLGMVTFSRAEGVYVGEHLNQEALEEIAMKMGSLGKSDERRERFAREREIRTNIKVAKAREKFRKMRASSTRPISNFDEKRRLTI
jgi:hypothetical protein